MKPRGKIRVLQLGSPTGLYGAERWILALVNNIDRAKIDAEVAVIRDDPALDADLCKQAETIGVPSTIFEAHGKFNWSAVRQVRSHIVKNGIDILHTHGYKTDIVGMFAVRGTNCKIITTPHGWTVNAGYKLKIYETIDRGAFYFFDGIIPLSEELYNGLKSIPFLRRKLRLIPNGVDLSDIDQGSDIADEIQEWKANGYFVIGYIGRLIQGKGLDILLRALARVKSRNWRLALIGDGDAREELFQLACETGLEDHVRFFGFRSDRLAFLKGFDAFVLPSLSEGVPRCLMEAMACRVPVITSNIPGCAALVQHGETGLLFDVGQADSLLKGLDELITNVRTREKLKVNARQLIVDKYSAEHMARQYADLYKGLVQGVPRESGTIFHKP